MGGLWKFLKQWLTKLIKVSRFCAISCKILQIIFCLLCGLVQFLELQVQFRHLLPQLGVPQLLKYVVDKDPNKCCKLYGDRGVPNCTLISSGVIDMIGGSS